MSRSVIVLGASGRFGRAATAAFVAAGWQVRMFARAAPVSGTPSGTDLVLGDAFDPDALRAACVGSAVIVNALNPPYQRWPVDMPRLTHSVLEAARASGATVMIPGNVYNYGANMPDVLFEDTPHRPTTKKGRLREDMERAYTAAADDGVQTIILRAGDFIERARTGNWFDTYIAGKVASGRVTYPGPLDRVHAWAYLPDMADAMVGLAEQRAGLAKFAVFGFEGLGLSGAELIGAMERAAGRPLKVRAMPWRMMALLGTVIPSIREVIEMRYLWDVPHAVDGARLAGLLPGLRRTPLEQVLGDVLYL